MSTSVNINILLVRPLVGVACNLGLLTYTLLVIVIGDGAFDIITKISSNLHYRYSSFGRGKGWVVVLDEHLKYGRNMGISIC